MELCLVLQAEVILGETGFYITEINFTAEFLGSNFSLPTFSTGSKFDFQVAYYWTAYKYHQDIFKAEDKREYLSIIKDDFCSFYIKT